MSFPEEYEQWLKTVSPELKKVFEILKARISDEPEKLSNDLANAEAYNARCSYLLAQANSFLDKAGLYYLPVRDPELKEIDRKVQLEASTAPIREIRDKIEGMCGAIKQRLILGESFLAYARQFVERNGR